MSIYLMSTCVIIGSTWRRRPDCPDSLFGDYDWWSVLYVIPYIIRWWERKREWEGGSKGSEGKSVSMFLSSLRVLFFCGYHGHGIIISAGKESAPLCRLCGRIYCSLCSMFWCVDDWIALELSFFSLNCCSVSSLFWVFLPNVKYISLTSIQN